FSNVRAYPGATKTGGGMKASDRLVATTEFRATLGALNITQRRAARLFDVTPRHIRRWQHGDRRVPHAVGIVCNLLAMGAVTIQRAEAAVPAPVRTNGNATPRPPAPRLVEPAPEQFALAPTLTEKIVALAPNACRWPYNDPRHPNFYFCSRPTAT